ncbi:MAG: DNRLRE domain-containing protein [Myxococcota bacterium]
MSKTSRREAHVDVRVAVRFGCVAVLVACSPGERPTNRVVPLGVQRQALLQSASFQRGVLPSSSYVATRDAMIQESAPTANFGASATCTANGDERNGLDNSCLFHWDVSAIPVGSTVTAASISLRVTKGSNNVYDLYELVRNWSESGVTWTLSQPGVPWGVAGALAPSDRGSRVGSLSGNTNTTQTIALNAAGIARVQAWVNDPSSNAGLILAHATNTKPITVATGENTTATNRPRLNVEYDSGSGGSGAGGSGSGGASAGGGSGGAQTSGGSPGTGGTPGEGGATSSGGSAGAGGTGGSGGTTVPDLLVAFIGDQGANGNSDAVLNLIKAEGAAAVVHNGDFDYADNPTAWDDRINRILGANFPYFAVIGNHDALAWNGPSGYAAKIAARTARVPDMNCAGELGVKATCNFRGLYLVESCVGVTEWNATRCAKDASEQVDFIRNALTNDDSVWSVCNWHKNQNDMQVGTKTDEVGWNAYRECMNHGGFIATGHEHSFSRTRTLTDLGNRSTGHGATAPFDIVQVAPGHTFVFTSGLAGQSVRPFDTLTHNDDTWWASYYTSDRWYQNGVLRSGVGTHGALFIRFHVGGDPRRANGYFKDVNGRIADQFTIEAR